MKHYVKIHVSPRDRAIALLKIGAIVLFFLTVITVEVMVLYHRHHPESGVGVWVIERVP